MYKFHAALRCRHYASLVQFSCLLYIIEFDSRRLCVGALTWMVRLRSLEALVENFSMTQVN